MTDEIRVIDNEGLAGEYINDRLMTRPSKQHPYPEHWATLKRSVVAATGGVCATCPALGIDLHHRHYDTFGNERVKDVALLCRDCHTHVSRSVWSRRVVATAYKPEMRVLLHGKLFTVVRTEVMLPQDRKISA